MRLAPLVYYCCFLLVLGLPSIKRHYKRHASFVWAWVAPCGCWVKLSGCSTCLCEIASVFTDRVDLLQQCPPHPALSTPAIYSLIVYSCNAYSCNFSHPNIRAGKDGKKQMFALLFDFQDQRNSTQSAHRPCREALIILIYATSKLPISK